MSAAVQEQPVQQRGRTIEELTSSVSASRLSLFHQCRLRFYFRHVVGLQKPKTPALHLGSCVHETLRVWAKARWKNEPLSLKALYNIYSSYWGDAQRNEPVEWEGTEEEERTSGFKLIETYLREGPIEPGEKPEAVEVSVEADLNARGLPKLIGIIDLVRSCRRIVDYKTSGKSPNPEQVAHLNGIQLTSYSVLYRHSTGQKENGLELHHLVKTKSPKVIVTELPPATGQQHDRLYRLMDSYREGLHQQDWVPSPGLQCASCEYFQECQAWS